MNRAAPERAQFAGAASGEWPRTEVRTEANEVLVLLERVEAFPRSCTSVAGSVRSFVSDDGECGNSDAPPVSVGDSGTRQRCRFDGRDGPCPEVMSMTAPFPLDGVALDGLAANDHQPDGVLVR